MMPSPPRLDIEALSIGYTPQRPLLPPLTLRAPAGRLVALLGRNGAGKSTLLKTLAGRIPPLAGAVRVEETPLHTLTPRGQARMLAFSPPRLDAPLSLTVEELVKLARFPHRGWFSAETPRDGKAVRQSLELAGIPQFAHRPLHSLSDGERQRAGLALALAQETPIMLLDEPTAFLDIPGRAELLALLQRLSRTTGKLIILSTHDLNTALWLADRLWIAHPEGIIDTAPEDAVLQGTISATFNTPNSQFDPWQCTFRPTSQAERPRGIYRITPSDGSLAHRCTAQALERLRYLPAPPQEMASAMHVAVETLPGGHRWRIDAHPPFESLTALAEALAARDD